VTQHISCPCADFSHHSSVSKRSPQHIWANVMLKIVLLHHRLYYVCCYCSETLYYVWFRICVITKVLVCNDTKTNFRFVITKRNLSARWFDKGVPSSSCTPPGHVNTIRQAKQFLHNYCSFTLDGFTLPGPTPATLQQCYKQENCTFTA
jgi:hypothetical protein